MTDQEKKDLLKYYESQFDMMATPGWQDFLASVVAIGQKEQSIDHITTLEQLYASKGRLDILRWVLGWKEACEKGYKDNQEPEEVSLEEDV